MAQDFSVKVDGLSKVQRMLNQADAKAALIVGLEFGVKNLQQKVGRYPPTSEANVPQTTVTGGATTIRWYERGYGTRYMRKDGSIGGRLTSAPLKDKWKTKVFKGNNPKGEVSNSATYSPFVQGSKEMQNRVHARRGWKRLPEEGKKLAPEVTKKVIDAFKRRMNK